MQQVCLDMMVQFDVQKRISTEFVHTVRNSAGRKGFPAGSFRLIFTGNL